MKYVAILALLTLTACGGRGAYVGDATNYVPNAQRVGNATWTGQEAYSPSEYAL
jgi:predicted small lipoprotein YifL